jgi:hypothetical protein
MKSLKLVAGSLMLLAAGAMNAQEEASNTRDMSPSFGVKGGVNFATVTSGNDNFNSPDSRTSFHVGAVGEFPLADIFSLQVEALYSGQGFEIRDETILNDQKTEYQLDYINVPVLAKVYLFEGFSLEAGPQFSFVVNEEIDTRPLDNAGDTNLEEAESFEFGVAAGLTFQTNMGLFASGRYNLGLTDIYNDANIQNSVFQISLGYKF